jgi:hypothetical protein
MMARLTDLDVVRELDSVPVFGILVKADGKLYTEEGACMVYTHLSDVSRVLGKMQATYPTTELEVMPLSLGHVLSEAGLLGGGGREGASLAVNLVASPEETSAAKRMREEAALPRPKRRRGAAGMLQRVPIFHIGTVETRRDAHDSSAGETLFPFFFRTVDVDALWSELGDGAPRPPLVATDLAALVDGLRDADAAPGSPLVCAPLDALDFVRQRDQRAAMDLAEGLAPGSTGLDVST